ncbi:MAG: hypothetical protein KBD78_09280 [Oligoflexales bacterium]|nr:hypothetical protein [Oligoflexales bacterium]
MTKVFFILIMFIISCQTNFNNNQLPRYTHIPINRAVEGIFGQVLLIEEKLTGLGEEFIVCVESNDELNDFSAAYFLETQMAYFYWLRSSEKLSPALWKSIKFVSKKSCHLEMTEFAAISKILKETDLKTPHNHNISFKKAKIECEKASGVSECKTRATIVGIGNVADLHFKMSDDNRKKWESVKRQIPAYAILSPYIHWQSLEEVISKARYRTPASIVEVQNFLNDYKKMLTNADIGYIEMENLIGQLEKIQLVHQGLDPEYANIVHQFKKQKEVANLEQNFLQTLPLFHVLLHEVGHQIGMHHADKPRLNDISGPSSTAQLNKDNQWVCSESIMAYHDPYLYLLEDDLLGAKSLFSQIELFITEKLDKI